jgi:hypothetical protein
MNARSPWLVVATVGSLVGFGLGLGCGPLDPAEREIELQHELVDRSPFG